VGALHFKIDGQFQKSFPILNKFTVNSLQIRGGAPFAPPGSAQATLLTQQSRQQPYLPPHYYHYCLMIYRFGNDLCLVPDKLTYYSEQLKPTLLLCLLSLASRNIQMYLIYLDWVPQTSSLDSPSRHHGSKFSGFHHKHDSLSGSSYE
jgi:hypothetical protein